jgi:ABC-2 type transport system permease protein
MPFLEVMRKDLKIIFRDRTALIFMLALPLVLTLLFGFIFAGRGGQQGSRGPMKILVANLDKGRYGAQFVAQMNSLGLTTELEPGGEAAAVERVKSGQRALGVILPPDFSDQMERAVGRVTGDPSAPQAHLKVVVDPAQSEVAGIAQGAIFAAAQRVFGSVINGGVAPSPEMSKENAPIALDVAPANAGSAQEKPTPGDLMIPGFAVYFVFFLANSVAVTLLNERQEGTLRRMLSAPISPAQVLFGKLLARGLIGLLQTALLFLIGVVWLKMHVGSSLPGLLLIVLITVFAATGLGLLIATFGKTAEQIQGMTTLVLTMMGLLSGCLVPRALMPDAMQKLSLITPHAWALNVYQDLMLRNLPLTNPSTLLNMGVVLLFGLGFFGLALARFRYE